MRELLSCGCFNIYYFMKLKSFILIFVLSGMFLSSAYGQEDKLSGKWVGTGGHWTPGGLETRPLTIKFRKTDNSSYEGLYGSFEMKNIYFRGNAVSFEYTSD